MGEITTVRALGDTDVSEAKAREHILKLKDMASDLVSLMDQGFTIEKSFLDSLGEKMVKMCDELKSAQNSICEDKTKDKHPIERNSRIKNLKSKFEKQ